MLDAIPAPRPLRLIIFDCDGVLIDSEPVASRVVAGALAGLGWTISAQQCDRLFRGMSLSAMAPLIERATGRMLPPGWLRELELRIAAAMSQEAQLVPGALEAIEAAQRLGLDWRIASNSGRAELAAKFARTGLTTLAAGRAHSAEDVIALGGAGKPAPDVFLAAAAASGCSPANCLVIEDSEPGVRGALAARMACLGYAGHGGEDLVRLGVPTILRLDCLPDLFAAGRVPP